MTDATEKPPLTLEVFSDYTCPWCYIGWARLDKALAALPPNLEVDVTWRPFEIHPEVPPGGMDFDQLHYSPEHWARMQEPLRGVAAEEGIDVSNRPMVSNTHQALAAGSFAQAEHPDRFPAFHEALFEGYFTGGRDLGDLTVLRELAERAGIDVARMDAALGEGRYDEQIEATSVQARSLGITGTPTFLFEGRYVASGAQPADVLVNAIQSLSERNEP